MKQAKLVELSKSSGIDYNAELQRIVRAVRKDVKNQVYPLVREAQPQYVTDAPWLDRITDALRRLKEKYSGELFLTLARRIADKFVTNTNRVNKERFQKATKQAFGIDVFADNPKLQDYLEASVADNVQLITSIPEQYLGQVESIILTGIRSGARSSTMAKQLREQFGVSERRAKFIARDQTAKINGDLNAKRQTDLGFEYFQWVTSKDQRVRDRHKEIANKTTAYGKGIYRWDNPPLNDKKTPIIPGQDYGCRCVGRAIPTFLVEDNQKKGDVRKGVYH